MDGIYSVLTVLTGLLLRIGLPILITLAVILWLRWLDARWQLEAADLLAGQGKPRPAVPCWEKRGCSEEKQKSCPVFGNREVFCWQFFRGQDGRLPEKCLTCKVFREAPVLVPA